MAYIDRDPNPRACCTGTGFWRLPARVQQRL